MLRKLAICADISLAITRCTASWSMSFCGDSAVRMRVQTRRCDHPCIARQRILSTAIWNVASCALAVSAAATIGGVLGIGSLLCSQFVIQIELCRVHRLGGLLGLPRQLIELCQRIIGRVGLHIRGEDAEEP